jgi:hypothetical protein
MSRDPVASMQRYHLERERTRAQWKLHWDLHVLMNIFDCPCDNQPGRFRKRRAFGHHRRCYFCHAAKYFQHPTRRHLIADYAYHEGIDELRDVIA